MTIPGPIRYEDARAWLDTGDVLLFSGKGGISATIKHFTRSRWSHVGMVVRLAELDLVALWESTTLSDVPDVEANAPVRGAQIVPLSARLQRYPGEVAVRRLIGPRTPAMLDALRQLRAELRGRPYERSLIELLRAAYDGPLGANAEDLASLFCSELVAEAYQRLGLLPERPPSNEYTPHDWSINGRVGVPQGIELRGGYVLLPEEMLRI